MTKTITRGLTMMALAAGGCMAGYDELGYDEVGYADEELAAALDCECAADTTLAIPDRHIVCWDQSAGVESCHQECDLGIDCNIRTVETRINNRVDSPVVRTNMTGRWSATQICSDDCPVRPVRDGDSTRR